MVDGELANIGVYVWHLQLLLLVVDGEPAGDAAPAAAGGEAAPSACCCLWWTGSQLAMPHMLLLRGAAPATCCRHFGILAES